MPWPITVPFQQHPALSPLDLTVLQILMLHTVFAFASRRQALGHGPPGAGGKCAALRISCLEEIYPVSGVEKAVKRKCVIEGFRPTRRQSQKRGCSGPPPRTYYLDPQASRKANPATRKKLAATQPGTCNFPKQKPKGNMFLVFSSGDFYLFSRGQEHSRVPASALSACAVPGIASWPAMSRWMGLPREDSSLADLSLKHCFELNCYWVGSLDFHFLGNQGVVP